ncbi:MAG: alpha/beta hydrolase [Caldilineales bacterium]|nr:alpha/beta hydrolase [Caldilineales bacterium]MDW8318936.1 alpha/beta hydrolase [Anaerolineae bacterium]
MKKAILVALAVLATILLVVFLWPVPRRSFEQLSDKVPAAERQSLLDFRSQHPPQRLPVNGQEWQYVAFGRGDKTILFLHGMTGAYDVWWQQMTPLSEQYRVISITYPAVDTLEELSQGVLAVLDAENAPRVYAVGSSLGGYLLQYLMAHHPERIERAVLGNTFPPNDILRERNQSLIRVLPLLPNWLVMNIFRQSFAENIYPAAGNSELVLAYMLEQASGRMSKAQVAGRAKAVIQPFQPPDPAALGIPVMIIEADNDPLVEPALRELLKQTYPTAEVHTLHNAGHFPYINEAETYTELLRSFFGR